MWVLRAGSPDPKETRKPRETRTFPRLAEDTCPIRVSPQERDWAQAGEQESKGWLLSMPRGFQGLPQSSQGSPPFPHTRQELAPLLPAPHLF